MSKCKPSEAAIARIEKWLTEAGWSLFRTKSEADKAEFGPNIVYSRATGSWECQVFSLLHECGHVILGFKEIDRIVNVPKKTSKSRWHRVSRAVNEVRAWDLGQDLAEELGIECDSLKFEKFRSRYLKNYFRLAAR